MEQTADRQIIVEQEQQDAEFQQQLDELENEMRNQQANQEYLAAEETRNRITELKIHDWESRI